MNNAAGWSKSEEASFQELVKKAAAESRLYYSRSAAPAPGYSAATPPQAEPTAMPRAVAKDTPRAMPKSTAQYVPQSTQRHAPAGQAQAAPNILEMLKGKLPALDSEGILLAALIWMLMEEKADNSIVLALLYILLV